MTNNDPAPAPARAPRPAPRFSLVTPSFNQAPYLEETIRSVLSQEYPNLEYTIIDGGSTDGSVEIIKKYQDRITRWVSEKDRGQYHALNKGLTQATGEIMGWINSDDKHCPWTLRTVADIFTDCPEVSWITTSTPMFWSVAGTPSDIVPVEAYAANWFYWGWHMGEKRPDRGWIQQESTFWRRSLWEAAGGRVDDAMTYAADFELWARFFQHATLATVNVPLGGFRFQPLQKTSLHLEKYYAEAHQVLKTYQPGRPPAPGRLGLLFRSFLRRVRRGHKRFGEPVQFVQYDHKQGKWRLDRTHVL